MKSKAKEVLSKSLPSQDEMQEIMDSFDYMDHRSGVITSSTYLEHSLRLLIKDYLRRSISAKEEKELFEGPSAPMGTFSAKIDMAYAFGIIGVKFRNKLNLIRDIRNACAHTLHKVDFRNPLFYNDVRKFYSLEEQSIFEDYVGEAEFAYRNFIGVVIGAITKINHRMYPYIRDDYGS